MTSEQAIKGASEVFAAVMGIHDVMYIKVTKKEAIRFIEETDTDQGLGVILVDGIAYIDRVNHG